MPKQPTYPARELDALGNRIFEVAAKLNRYGDHMKAAKWLVANGHQDGDVVEVAKKISNLLKGYVRGIHYKMRSGGVWRAQEADRVITLLEFYLEPRGDVPVTSGMFTYFPGREMSAEDYVWLVRSCNQYGGIDTSVIPDCLCFAKFPPATRRRT